MDEATAYALRHVGGAFRVFARIGRWGTCGFCPRDREGNVYPEFCADTARYDHQLTADQLAATFNRYKESVLREQQQQAAAPQPGAGSGEG